VLNAPSITPFHFDHPNISSARYKILPQSPITSPHSGANILTQYDFRELNVRRCGRMRRFNPRDTRRSRERKSAWSQGTRPLWQWHLLTVVVTSRCDYSRELVCYVFRTDCTALLSSCNNHSFQTVSNHAQDNQCLSVTLLFTQMLRMNLASIVNSTPRNVLNVNCVKGKHQLCW
jgi:hypothetical protein